MSSIYNSPCKECGERKSTVSEKAFFNCHTSCQDYLNWQQKLKDLKEQDEKRKSLPRSYMKRLGAPPKGFVRKKYERG